MSEQRLLEYIKNERSINISDPEIKNNLLNVGWKEEDIDSALGFIGKNNPIQSNLRTNNLEIKDSKDIEITAIDKILSWILIVLLSFIIVIIIIASVYMFILHLKSNGFDEPGFLSLVIMSGLEVLFSLGFIFALFGFFGTRNKILLLKNSNINVPFSFNFVNVLSKLFLIFFILINIAVVIFFLFLGGI